MATSIESHAHRKLRRLHRYVPASEMARTAPALVRKFTERTGTIVGCYRNDGGSDDDWIVFTTYGIGAMFSGAWRYIHYSEIKEVVRQNSKSIESDDVLLGLRSQSVVTISVNGKDADKCTHDKHCIMMFIESVIGEANGDWDSPGAG
jgi:hypothetical protein